MNLPVFEHPPEFHKTRLSNGVCILTEHHRNTRATSAGIYVGCGSRDEPAGLEGAAHFIEHLVFKGTKKRSAMDIAKSLEAVGGDLNAYTSREYTCFHGTTLKEHLPLNLDVLVDLVSQAQFKNSDFDMERQVILHEIDMSADQLEEYIFDLYFEHAYRGQDIGRPILGTAESLASIKRKSLFEYYHSNYRADGLTIAVAGDVDHESVVQMVKKSLSRHRPRDKKAKRRTSVVKSFQSVIQKSSEQVHLLLGFPSASFKDKYRFESYICNAWLGGGMTSKLYQSIREKKGLAYSVYSYLHSFTDSGLIMVYAGTAPSNARKVLTEIKAGVQRLQDHGVSQKDLDFFKTQVKGQILLGADDIDNRMNSLAVNEMVFGRYRPVEEVIAEIEAVSRESIRSYVEAYLCDENKGVIMIGDLDQDKALQWI